VDLPPDPPYSVPAAQLAAAVDCPATFSHGDREPVLLVHGTGTRGHEEYAWNYELLLADAGFDVCVVTYPDRGLGDMQVSAEYIAYAVNLMHNATGRPVDMVGHSQGGLMPRWAIKWWPSVQSAVDDFVMLASPNHGTDIARGAKDAPFPMSAVMRQFDPASEFVRVLNAGDETPGDISYTSIYSAMDQLVLPALPVPTAGLEWGSDSPAVSNILIQDVCPGRVVEHLGIGTTDRAAQILVIDALVGDGPGDAARAGLSTLCSLPDQQSDARMGAAAFAQMQDGFRAGFPNWHSTTREPEIKPYARQQ
jgi:hypothetical protein